MSDIQAVIAAYTGPRTIPVDQIPDIPRDATEDELRMLQLAMGQTAIAVKTVLNHVGMTDATKPADAAKTLALWERHEQTVAPTQSPFDPPLLELEHADMDPALIRWFMADHMDWTIKSRWCFTRTHDAGLATLSIDATNAEGEPVRFHVVFNLWFPLHAEVARRIDVTHGLGLTIAPLRKPARPVPTAGGVLEPYGGIVIRLSTLVLDAMLCDPALSDLYERTSSAEDVWNEVTRPTAYDWWAGEVLRATPPIRPELHSQGGVPAMYLGRVKGIGQIVLSSDPFLQPYDRHDWLPIAGRCHLHFERSCNLFNRLEEPWPVGILWVMKKRRSGRLRSKVLERLQPLSPHRVLKTRESGEIAARPCQACDDPVFDRIGDPFMHGRSRAEPSGGARGPYEGMGLGLFIAKTLLERSGASVALSNCQPPERGARIVIQWPRSAVDLGSNPA